MLLAANQAARRILAVEGAIRSRDGRLCADEAGGTRGLRALIARAAEGGAGRGDEDRVFSIAARDGGGAVLQIFATPLAGGEGRVALVLGGEAQPGAFNVRAFARLFDLSPAEARIVRALAAGATVQGFADEMGLSEGTIRLQLKRALAKTGCSRQSDLVRLVCASPLWSALPLASSH
jgi:DNA-binding CsgD family transcriptional regulator